MLPSLPSFPPSLPPPPSSPPPLLPPSPPPSPLPPLLPPPQQKKFFSKTSASSISFSSSKFCPNVRVEIRTPETPYVVRPTISGTEPKPENFVFLKVSKFFRNKIL